MTKRQKEHALITITSVIRNELVRDKYREAFRKISLLSKSNFTKVIIKKNKQDKVIIKYQNAQKEQKLLNFKQYKQVPVFSNLQNNQGLLAYIEYYYSISFSKNILLSLILLSLATSLIILFLFNTTIEKIYINDRQKFLIENARRVAHDIRSPLSALSIATDDLNTITSKKKIIINQALSRIRDIANDLLNDENDLNFNINDSGKSSHFSILAERLITEKNILNKNKNRQISIDLNISKENRFTFLKIEKKILQRILSNLIDNAIEASHNYSTISISTVNFEKDVSIIVKDSGTGIPERILSRLNQGEALSYKKENGHGIGLSFVRSSIEKTGGSLQIESIQDEGSEVTLKIPKAQAPDWFCPKISLNQINNIIIVDDEIVVHNFWAEKLTYFKEKLKIEYYLDNNFSVKGSEKALYLVDYDLNSSSINGLEWIIQNQIGNKSILVTSFFDNLEIQKKCVEIGAKILPKELMAYVPIKSNENLEMNVLIEDEEIIREGWKMVAQKNDINLKTFSSSNDFKELIDSFSKATVFYIDHNLGENDNGLDLAEWLFQKNYRNIYLATGHSSKEYENIPFIKGVIGKNPPWT